MELLSLTGNFLRNVPTEALRKMESLSILYLNNNGIEKIHEDSFMGFGQNLTDVWLQNNGYVSNVMGQLFLKISEKKKISID